MYALKWLISLREKLSLQGVSMADVVLTKYEKARIIGARSLQLSCGAPPLLAVDPKLTPMDIASNELDEGVIPLVVIR